MDLDSQDLDLENCILLNIELFVRVATTTQQLCKVASYQIAKLVICFGSINRKNNSPNSVESCRDTEMKAACVCRHKLNCISITRLRTAQAQHMAWHCSYSYSCFLLFVLLLSITATDTNFQSVSHDHRCLVTLTNIYWYFYSYLGQGAWWQK